VNALPQIVVIGRDGIVRYLEVGYSQNQFAELRKKLDDLLAQKAP